MRIGIFAGAAGRQASGPETYEHCLLKALAEIDRETEYRVFCFSQAAANSFAIEQENFQFEILRPKVRWLSLPISLPMAMNKAQVGLCHATFVPPPFSPKPLVMTLHGSDMFVHPEFFHPTVRWRLTALLRRGFKHAALVICVSQHVRDVVQERFKLPDDRLAVIHHGIESSFQPMSAEVATTHVATKYGITKPYIFYAGKIVSSKNIERLVDAFRGFRRAYEADVQLVLAGKSYPRMGRIQETLWQAAEAEGVLRIGHVPHNDLPYLYCAARVFAFPSLWEGFGLPVAEAMACGVPVITSNNSCLQEIAGDAALLVDPYSTEEIQDALTRLFFDEVLRAELRKKGLQRATSFNWNETAKQTRAAYERALT